MFRAWSYLQPPLYCLVYPRPLTEPLPPLTATAHDGQYDGALGQGDFIGLRLRQPNDSPRHIAWKAVARDIDHRPLLVKQFAGGGAGELWLDWSYLPDECAAETRLSILAGWVLAAEREGLRYGLRLPDAAIGPAQGLAHRDACLEILALYPA